MLPLPPEPVVGVQHSVLGQSKAKGFGLKPQTLTMTYKQGLSISQQGAQELGLKYPWGKINK